MISVVIPLYNKAHTIVNTLSTVINQIYTDFEIVIVNDGSTDNGVNTIVQHFSDPRIRIINQPNAGGQCCTKQRCPRVNIPIYSLFGCR